jgi:hypothetical protein
MPLSPRAIDPTEIKHDHVVHLENFLKHADVYSPFDFVLPSFLLKPFPIYNYAHEPGTETIRCLDDSSFIWGQGGTGNIPFGM